MEVNDFSLTFLCVLPCIILALELQAFTLRQVRAVCSPSSEMALHDCTLLWWHSTAGCVSVPECRLTAGGLGALRGFVPDEMMDLHFEKLTPAFIAE